MTNSRPQGGLKTWHIIAIVFGLVLFVCIVGGVIAASDVDDEKMPVGGAASSAPASSAAPAVVASVAPKVLTVKGTGNSAVQIGEVLNGAFTVQYAFGSWCGQAAFLKADGSAGARFMQDINDCAASTSDKLTGSTVVNLSSVSLVNVGNTKGNWSLTFTPLG